MRLGNLLPIILTIFLLKASVPANAQKPDSLKEALNRARGSERCMLLYQTGYELVDVEPGSALQYANNSIACAREFRDTLLLVKSVQLKAIAFRRLGQVDSSNNLITSVLPIAREKGYNNELQDLLHGLALGFVYKAEFDKSLKYNFEALELRKQHGTEYQVGLTLSSIAFVYYKLADYQKALQFYLQSLTKLSGNTGDRKPIVPILINIALIHAYTRNNEDASNFLRDALQRCNQDCTVSNLQQIAFCRGIVALNRADSTTAKIFFLESYNMAKREGDKRIELDNIIYLSRICLSSEQMSEAKEFLDIAEELIEQGVPYNMELMKIYNEFASLYERKGEFKKVVEFQKRHMALKDSIYDDEVTTRLMRIEAAHIEQEKNKEIEVQSNLLALNKEIIWRQQIATALGYSLVVVVISISAFIIREKRRRSTDLEGRVHKRTLALENLATQSHLSLAEKKAWTEKMVTSVRHVTNTVTGLSLLARKDPESSEECFDRIQLEMKQLLTQITDYAAKSDESTRNFRAIG